MRRGLNTARTPGVDRKGLTNMTAADPLLNDPDLLDEIELYGELVIAASASREPLAQDEIDRVLGVRTNG